MYSIVPILIILIVVLVLVRLVIVFGDKIKFISKGLDSKFKLKEILLLWRLAKTSNLEDPSSLFLSVHALNRSIAYVISTSRANQTEHTKEIQDFLTRLYEYRTKVELDPQLNKGLKSTKGLAVGQKVRIVLKGYGVFSSTIVNVGRTLTLTLPLRNGIIHVPAADWVNQVISVYLWRNNDASYVFDSVVLNSGLFNSKVVINLQHTEDLLRTQKRKSVRCQCKIPAQMYLVKSETADLTSEEHEDGLKCIIEDISEGGAFIRIGGRGKKDMQIKLQFYIDETVVIMHGFVKAVEYLEAENQSRLHFECLELDPRMKNTILSYVYNVLPQEEKDAAAAIALAEEDERTSFGEANLFEDNSQFSLVKQVDENKTNIEKNLSNNTYNDDQIFFDYSSFEENNNASSKENLL